HHNAVALAHAGAGHVTQQCLLFSVCVCMRHCLLAGLLTPPPCSSLSLLLFLFLSFFLSFSLSYSHTQRVTARAHSARSLTYRTAAASSRTTLSGLPSASRRGSTRSPARLTRTRTWATASPRLRPACRTTLRSSVSSRTSGSR